MKQKQRRTPRAAFGRGFEGEFDSFEGEYRRCFVSDCEVRVWGAEEGRGLSSALVGQLRWIVGSIGRSHPIALMADHHAGVGGVIGSVVASSEHVLPAIIGGDCGCGVAGVRLKLGSGGPPSAVLDFETRVNVYREILHAVPVGRAHHTTVDPSVERLPLWESLRGIGWISKRDIWKLQHQLGTLGGGNHFLELAADADGALWVLVHSGSRYLGGLLMSAYQGRLLQFGDPEAERFFTIQQHALEYARESRATMVRAVLTVLSRRTDLLCEVSEAFDLPHNFIEERSERKHTVVLHRKGACAAEAEQLGVIPGSMAAGSYLVYGRGNPDAYWSSSHGAGRQMTRGEAHRQLSWKQIQRAMSGIVWANSQRMKDEAPQAYKPLEGVMRSQRSLVRIRSHLRPLLVVKGDT